MKHYWKSLEALEKNPEFEAAMQKEFLHTPEELSADVEADEKSGVSRREFLRLMGASVVMASAAACTRRPVEKIVPYLNKPQEITIGIPNWYASTCGECPAACGLLVKTREGRPIKLEGNNEHPLNQGKMCARGQASILNLYDPDRLKGPMKNNNGSFKETTWEEADKTLQEVFKNIQNKKGSIRLLTGHIPSPATRRLIQEFLGRFENAKQVVFEPLSLEEVSRGQEASYGTPVVPHYHIDKAKILVSFGADFLDTWLSPVEFTNRFAKNRKLKNGSMSKFVCFESIASLTGSNADLRIPVKAGDELKIALALAHELGAPIAADTDGVDRKMIRQLALELKKYPGETLVLGGGYANKGPDGLALQIVCNFINSVLGNDGSTIDAQNSPSLQAGGSYEELFKLIDEMANAQVDLLLIYKTNPAYILPKHFKFEEAVQKVPLVVDFADREDETAALAHWILAENHYLESWGDAEPLKGLFSLFQPTIRPLYNTRSFQETLLAWSPPPLNPLPQGEGKKRETPPPLEGEGRLSAGSVAEGEGWHDYLKKFWQENIYARSGALVPFELFWESALRSGVVDLRRGSGHAPRPFNANALTALKIPGEDNALHLMVYPTIPAYDGRSANNSWLKELPDPVTKITWSNFISVAPEKAKELKIKDGDVVKVKTANAELKAVVHLQPGQPKEVVSIPLGFGRTKAGEVGNEIGTNAFQFISKSKNGDLVWFTQDVEIHPTGEWVQLAKTQIHDHMHGRPIVQETTLAEYQKDPKAGNENPTHLPSMWSKHKYEGYRWGMAIDLNSCTGCSACVIACQAENNIPVVGPERVKRGREMHWIRIDRYYEGDEKNPKVAHQPMLCQHCENAPCETVCPVLATVHDDEGLNVQIYNRCVGTRYCNNNCPYKVRRFNWFEYLRETPAPLAMVFNPDVTVREKGVMEKCTFCHQRIQEGKNKAKDFGVEVKDGEIQSACQQTCPAEAIVFGNLNDPESRVSKMAKSDRGYHVLADLNTVPSITYLTKVRNEG